jgi:TatD DNase family protein
MPGYAHLESAEVNLMPELLDTHAHLDAEQFAGEVAAVIARAHAAGVVQVIAVATTAPSSATCVKLAGEHASVFATVGIHPNEAVDARVEDWDDMLRLAREARVVGIGETGLDRHWHRTPFALQEEYFARHLELGRQLGRAVVIHCRDCEADILRMLREAYERHGPIRGVMHSFTGSLATAEACLAMGLHLSFAGMLTYKNANELRAVAVRVPLERVLVETDSPYLSPVPLRGKRNEPANVVHTAACLAGLHGIDAEEMAERTTRNARELFGLPTSGVA